jgi:interleukin-1 receptor-associated kinase 4
VAAAQAELAAAIAERDAEAERQRLAAEEAERVAAAAAVAKLRGLTAASVAPHSAEPPIVVGQDYVSRCTGGFADGRVIGRGGFGTVFRAVDAALGVRFAVKRVGGHDSAFGGARSAVREVELLTRFRHPHLIRLLGYTAAVVAEGAAEDAAPRCVLYELAERGSLDAHLMDDARATELSWERRLRCATGVAAALNFLHRSQPGAKAFHRDVKAANVALMADWSPRLIDGGLAKLFQEQELAAVAAAGGNTVAAPGYGVPFGSQGYRCPELLEGAPFSERSEVYSFGALLLELLTGRLSQVSPGHAGNLPGLFFRRREEALAAARDARMDARSDGAWPARVAEALEELAERSCGVFHARPRMVDALRVLQRLEAQHAVAPRLADAMTRELIARAEATAAAADASLRACQVCCDEWPLGAGGLECGGSTDGAPHFYCFACLSSAALPRAGPRLAAGLRCEGRLGGDGCDAPPYDHAALARGLSPAVLAALRDAALGAQREALSAEFARERQALKRALAEAEARAGRVESLRLDVIERILTPKCPRCLRAFLGFTGCFALRCAPDEADPAAAAAAAAGGGAGALAAFCGAAFCGWCFADCGSDAHEHVRSCAHNRIAHRGYFGTLDLFHDALRASQRSALDAYLTSLEPALREPLRAALRHDLADLGLM